MEDRDMSPSRSVRRFLLTSALSLLALFAFAAVASASTLTRTGNDLTYAVDAGDLNDVFVTYTGPGTFSMSDFGVAAIDATGAAGCTPDVDPRTVNCTGTITSFRADLGDQDTEWWRGHRSVF